MRKACDDELQRRYYVEKSRTKCRKVFKEMLTEPALKCWHHRLMWLLSERPLGISSTRRLCAAVGQFSEMQIAVSTRQQSFLPPIALDLKRLGTAAEMQLNRQQCTPAVSLEAVLLELGLKAKKAIKLCPGTVVLLERGIIFRWRPPSKDRLSRPLNYLEWPASALQPLDEHTDSDSDDCLVAVLCRCREFAQQARNGTARDPKVVVAIKLRDDQTIGLLSKVHS